MATFLFITKFLFVPIVVFIDGRMHCMMVLNSDTE